MNDLHASSTFALTRRALLRCASYLGLLAPLTLAAACAPPSPSGSREPPPPTPAAPGQPAATQSAPATPQPHLAQPAPTGAPAQIAGEKVRLTFGKGGLATAA